jgi:hypothetical protein
MDVSGHLFLVIIDMEMQRISHKDDAMMNGDKKVAILVDDVNYPPLKRWACP